MSHFVGEIVEHGYAQEVLGRHEWAHGPVGAHIDDVADAVLLDAGLVHGILL